MLTTHLLLQTRSFLENNASQILRACSIYIVVTVSQALCALELEREKERERERESGGGGGGGAGRKTALTRRVTLFEP